MGIEYIEQFNRSLANENNKVATSYFSLTVLKKLKISSFGRSLDK